MGKGDNVVKRTNYTKFWSAPIWDKLDNKTKKKIDERIKSSN